MAKKKVSVSILNMGTTSAGMETMLYRWMLSTADKYIFDLSNLTPSERPIPANRNHIVKKFLKTDNDILYMQDDDNPPLQNPFELLQYDKDVIAVPTPGNNKKGIGWMVFQFGDEYPEKITFKPFPTEKRKGLQRVDAISTGCIFIKRKVLENIKRPFEDIFDEDGCIINSDDMGFADKCKKAGFEIWTHFDYFCSHYKTVDLLQMLRMIQMAHKAGVEEGKKVL